MRSVAGHEEGEGRDEPETRASREVEERLVDLTRAGTMLSRVCRTSKSARSPAEARERVHLLDNAKTVSIVALQHVGAHEGEDGHNVVHELIGNQRSELRKKEQSLVVGLRVLGRCVRRRKFSSGSPKVSNVTAESLHLIKSRTGVMRIESLVTPELGPTFSTTLLSAESMS